jgi:cytochrome b6-f complex iron-sulfur subunit
MANDGRRKFLGLCLGGTAVAFFGAAGWSTFRYLAPHQEAATAAKVTIPEAELLPGEAKFFAFAGSPAVVVRTENGTLMALSAVCTHLGCIVQWEKEQRAFLCPCHAGRFSPEGQVISGPPPQPLARLPVAVANGTITVG